MREILFRGKRVNDGEWVFGYYMNAKHHWNKLGVHEDWILCNACQNGGWFTLLNKYAVDPSTVGQYTGLIDENGVKIFEGDTVRCKDLRDRKLFCGVVTYANASFRVTDGDFHHYRWEDYEVTVARSAPTADGMEG